MTVDEWTDPAGPPRDDATNHGSGVWSSPSPEGYGHDLWLWHWCDMRVEGAKGRVPFWRPGGVGLHTLLAREPLTLTPSLYWTECCGKHGFLTDGVWRDC